jgi:hypothetical protein
MFISRLLSAIGKEQSGMEATSGDGVISGFFDILGSEDLDTKASIGPV